MWAALIPLAIPIIEKALPVILAWLGKKDNSDWLGNLFHGSGASMPDLSKLLSGLFGGGSTGSSDGASAAQLKRIADALEGLLPKGFPQPSA